MSLAMMKTPSAIATSETTVARSRDSAFPPAMAPQYARSRGPVKRGGYRVARVIRTDCLRLKGSLMSTVAVIIIVVVVLVALALLYSAMRRRQAEAHLEDRRQVASAHRQEADQREREAQEAQAAADAHAEHARDVDPDTDTTERREPPRQ